MLAVRDLHAYYGKSHILQGVSFDVGKGEIVSLLGRNGAGRSTTIKAIMGDVPLTGSIRFRDEEVTGLRPHEIARKGLGYVPENRDIFPGLTVRENLILGMKSTRPSARWTFDDMFELFPVLGERAGVLGGVLSGGEQQMLTICRTLMGDPDLIMIDEPTEGLAPRWWSWWPACWRESPSAAYPSCSWSRSSRSLSGSARASTSWGTGASSSKAARGSHRQRRHPQGMARGVAP